MKYKKICIINYKLNNISSIIKALKENNIQFDVLEDGSELEKYTHIILPGIGSFEAGVRQLKLQNFFQKLNKPKQDSKILGICLGMQLLFECSEESEDKSVAGLSLIKGKVKKMSENIDLKIYIPHIGWNKIENKSEIKNIKINTQNDFYFANSFYVNPDDKNIIKYTFQHGHTYPAAIQFKNYYGFQFHPEKSSSGIDILKNFCNID